MTAHHWVVNENIVLLQGLNGKLFLYHADSEKLSFLNKEKEFNVAMDLKGKELYALTTEGLRIVNAETVEEKECSIWETQIEKSIQENYSAIIVIDTAEENGKEVLYLAERDGIVRLDGKEKRKLVDGKKAVFGDINYVLRHICCHENDIFVVVKNEENEDGITELYQYSYDKN